MAKTQGTRRLKVEMGCVQASCGWSDSTLTFREWRPDGVVREAVVGIESPADLRWLRHELEKIEANWRKMIG